MFRIFYTYLSQYAQFSHSLWVNMSIYLHIGKYLLCLESHLENYYKQTVGGSDVMHLRYEVKQEKIVFLDCITVSMLSMYARSAAPGVNDSTCSSCRFWKGNEQ